MRDAQQALIRSLLAKPPRGIDPLQNQLEQEAVLNPDDTTDLLSDELFGRRYNPSPQEYIDRAFQQMKK